MKPVKFSDLKGQIITSIDINKSIDEIIFKTKTKRYLMFHSQDCCESVEVEDIIGDLKDVLNSEVLLAEEVTSHENPDGIKKDYQDSFTWTFYKLSTIKGSVTIRWYGSSNGYYSERVDFEEV